VKRIFIDTNAYAQLLRDSKDVLDVLSIADEVYMSVIVLGELYSGFRGGSKYEQNVKILYDFLNDPIVKVLDLKEESSELFGKIKHELKINGTPIPINDIWIAAQCIEIGAVLISYDLNFKLIPQILLWEKM
jgi:tRNA(fMet)-specific endonuclease VapC